jgi:hypothetical protein
MTALSEARRTPWGAHVSPAGGLIWHQSVWQSWLSIQLIQFLILHYAWIILISCSAIWKIASPTAHNFRIQYAIIYLPLRELTCPLTFCSVDFNTSWVTQERRRFNSLTCVRMNAVLCLESSELTLTEHKNTVKWIEGLRVNEWKVNVKLSLCFFNWAPCHEGVLGKWRYSSTHSWCRH